MARNLAVPVGETRTVEVGGVAIEGEWEARGPYADLSPDERHKAALADLGHDHPATLHFGQACGALVLAPPTRPHRPTPQTKLF